MSSSDGMEQSRRDNSYNQIRFVGASLVILGHMYVLSGMAEPRYLGIPIQTQGLNILIVVSGYWIAQSCKREEKFGNYLLKRIFRLIPALCVCVLISAFLIGPLFTWLSPAEYYKHPQCREYLLNIVLNPKYALPGVFAANPYPNAVNGSLWSLPVEFVLYFVMWGMVSALDKRDNLKIKYLIMMVLVCIVHILIIVFFREKRIVIWGTDWLGAWDMVPFFFFGGMFYFVPIRKYCCVLPALLMLIAGFVIHTEQSIVNEILSYIIIPYVVITFGECKQVPFLAKVPEFSYGMYLWGFVVQQCLEAVCIKRGWILEAGVSKYLIIMCITCVMALVSWASVEKWGRSLSLRILRGSRCIEGEN